MDNKLKWHIFFVFTYIIIGVLLFISIKGGFYAHNSWICTEVNYSEKGVTSEEIDFCTNLGLYDPKPGTKYYSLVYPFVALLSFTIIISLVVLSIAGAKHYKILRGK